MDTSLSGVGRFCGWPMPADRTPRWGDLIYAVGHASTNAWQRCNLTAHRDEKIGPLTVCSENRDRLLRGLTANACGSTTAFACTCQVAQYVASRANENPRSRLASTPNAMPWCWPGAPAYLESWTRALSDCQSAFESRSQPPHSAATATALRALAWSAWTHAVRRVRSTCNHNRPVTLARRKPVSGENRAIAAKCSGRAPISRSRSSRVSHRMRRFGSGNIRTRGALRSSSNRKPPASTPLGPLRACDWPWNLQPPRPYAHSWSGPTNHGDLLQPRTVQESINPAQMCPIVGLRYLVRRLGQILWPPLHSRCGEVWSPAAPDSTTWRVT